MCFEPDRDEILTVRIVNTRNVPAVPDDNHPRRKGVDVAWPGGNGTAAAAVDSAARLLDRPAAGGQHAQALQTATMLILGSIALW